MHSVTDRRTDGQQAYANSRSYDRLINEVSPVKAFHIGANISSFQYPPVDDVECGFQEKSAM